MAATTRLVSQTKLKYIKKLVTHLQYIHLEMGHSTLEKIGHWLKVSIKYGDKLIILDIAATHSRFQIACFVTLTNDTMAVHYAGPVLLPLLHLFPYQCLSSGVV
jgi:hypothetical protein